MNHRRRKNSVRLAGYDYTQPGAYFITLCTAHRRRILGEVVGGRMRLSEIGRFVDECWQAIPSHFANTALDAFQIMPNHLHGIIAIKENAPRDPCRGVQLNTPTENRFAVISPKKGSLGIIIHF